MSGGRPAPLPSHLSRLLVAGAAIVGFIFGAFAFITIEISVGGQPFRTGPDLDAYLRAGRALLDGQPVYVGQIGDPTNFPYAPPWAVVAAGLAVLPPLVDQAAIIALDLVAMWYVGRGWRGVGLMLLWPLTAFELSAGNIDLLIAAAIVLAWSPGPRGRVALLVAMAYAKLAPALAIPPRCIRGALISAAVLALVTLPVLHLWPEWFAYLLRQPASIAISLPVGPWYLRLPVALALAVLGSRILRRPWLSALAVVVAMPSLYLSTTVILIAPIRLWLDSAGENWPAAGEEREVGAGDGDEGQDRLGQPAEQGQ